MFHDECLRVDVEVFLGVLIKPEYLVTILCSSMRLNVISSELPKPKSTSNKTKFTPWIFFLSKMREILKFIKLPGD